LTASSPLCFDDTGSSRTVIEGKGGRPSWQESRSGLCKKPFRGAQNRSAMSETINLRIQNQYYRDPKTYRMKIDPPTKTNTTRRSSTRFKIWALFTIVLAVSSCEAQKQSSSQPVTRANPESKRSLGSFERVEGTNYLIAAISSRENDGSSILGSKGYNSSDVHNYVFMNIADASVHRLAPTNDDLIVSTISFPERNQNEIEKSERKVEWFLYSVVKTDTDGDKELSEKDKQTLAISDAIGVGFTEIIQDVDSLLGSAISESNRLLLVYKSAGKNYTSQIDLPSRKVLSTNELPPLGEDVR
jgi:hypothetical protein